MVPNHLFAPYPTKLIRPSQLRGLEHGDFVAQPYWFGCHATHVPGRPITNSVGHAVHRSTLQRVKLPEIVRRPSGLAVDLVLLSRRAVVTDIMIARPFDDRERLAHAYGIDLGARAVHSRSDINDALATFGKNPDCAGLILKRRAAAYPWLPIQSRPAWYWLLVQQPIELSAESH